jgi:flagellar motility protein MotE (MotC chaperone)
LAASENAQKWGAFMNFKLIVAILAIACVPVCALAQASNPPKPSKPAKAAPAVPVTKAAAAQKLVKTISGDKAKTQTYCDIGKLGDQIEEAEQKKDLKKIDELNQKMDELATKLGPEYVALIGELQDIDPNSKDGQDISLTLEGLDKLCAK